MKLDDKRYASQRFTYEDKHDEYLAEAELYQDLHTDACIESSASLIRGLRKRLEIEFPPYLAGVIERDRYVDRYRGHVRVLLHEYEAREDKE